MEKPARTRTAGSPGAAMLTTKRKLDFSAHQQEKEVPRLSAKGRCFYLDLVGRDDLTARYQQELTRRGAVVAQFFDKCVEVLVTNRSGSGQSGGRLSGSPATNPSPALASLSRQSPFSNSPRTSIESSNGNLALSRGKMAVAMAKKHGQKSGQNDLVAKATDWGTKVWNMSKLEEYLLATKGQAVAGKDRKHSKTGSGGSRGVPKVRTLRVPFIKVEDRSRAYKPLVLEVKAWPTPNAQCSPEGSPFDSPPQRKDKAKRQVEKRPTPVTPKQPVIPLEKKAGYCECCRAHFPDAKMHLRGEQHLAFATNAKNYEALDELISQGTSFNDFLAKYTKVTVVPQGVQLGVQQATVPDSKPSVVECTPGFITPGTVPGTKRARPASGSADSSSNSPKRIKLVLSPSSHPEGTPCVVDSGVCLQPDTRCKSPLKEEAVSSDQGQSPLLRSGRRLRRLPDTMDETPLPFCEEKKQVVVSSPRTLTPDLSDTPTPVRHSPRLNGKVSPVQPGATKTPAPPTPQKNKYVSNPPSLNFDLTIVVADVSPVGKELAVVLSPRTPYSQASTVSVPPRDDTASSASSWYQPSKRKSLRHLAKKLKNATVSPDADWKQEQREAFQISLSSSVASTPTRSIASSAQPSPKSGLGSVSCAQSNANAEEKEASSGRRQMPPRRCKRLSPTFSVAAIPRNRRSRNRRQ